MNSKEKIQSLFQKYLSGTAVPEEKEELANLILSADDEIIAGLLKNTWEDAVDTDSVLNMEEKESILNEILGKKRVQTPVISLFSRRWFRVAAACIILMIGVGGYFLLNNTSGKSKLAENNLSKDVEAPKISKAMITLADGKEVYLDKAIKGQLAVQSNVKLVKLANGEIVYQTASGETTTQLQYNTLSNPRGSKTVSLTLNDGTKVWLNSESSLKYPVSFIGNERKVEITGEAYFEVAHDATKPFKVNIAGKEEVEVLGTHFNINSYSDETTTNTTLLEGRVKITPVKDSRLMTDDSRLLSPDQQAQLNSEGEIILKNDVNTEQVMAWKNGKFNFGEAMDIASVMRQVSRWYDVDIEYEGKVNASIGGSISRNVNVSQILKMLEETQAVNFKVEGEKVIVMSNRK